MCFLIYQVVKSIQSISIFTSVYLTTPFVLLKYKYFGWFTDIIKLNVVGHKVHSGFEVCYH